MIALLLLLLSPHASAAASANLTALRADASVLRSDLALIEAEGLLKKGTLQLLELAPGESNQVKVSCKGASLEFRVRATPGEESATLYKGLREAGFLFPHPRWQITPSETQRRRACGKTFGWNPTLKYRGFHLHTLHPNEWVHGFFMYKPRIAEDTVRWIARNGQNLIDMNLVRSVPFEELRDQIAPAYRLANQFGIYTGVSLGLAFTQQKSYKLINLWQAFTGFGADPAIEAGLVKLTRALPLSFLVLEAGTSEFTPVSYEKSRKWMNLAARIAREQSTALFIKVHVSTNQKHEQWGNFNFLPQHADPAVGILPHTVFFYGLLDPKTPIYGNKDFSEMRQFIVQERGKRPTWYYPETSYWIGMDLDIPLLLTDYLRTRAEDYKWLHDQGVEGHLNFSTGHALAGWLMDWNVALMADADYKFDPYTALRLLGEPLDVWKAHVEFQKLWFKEKGLIAPLSAANLQDELSETERIHDRNTMKQLSNNPEELRRELALLQEGLKHWPAWEKVKNFELRELLHDTWRRHQHALYLRRALATPEKAVEFLNQAAAQREQMQASLKGLSKLPTSYPELPLFERHLNPTSYQFGYVYPAASGYFWDREEVQIRHKQFFPFKGNMYDVWNILF